MEDRVSTSLMDRRTPMLLATGFAAVALFLAAIGIYGVLAYQVSQRRREIGIRMALGARGTDVRLMVLAQSSRIAIVATVIGIAIAIGLGRLGESMLFGVTALDLRAQGGAAALMLAIALAAALLPARRAAGVDPVDALRAE